jgi:hypothetical protein
MWLPWKAALWCALVLALISVVLRPNGRRLRVVVDVSRESAILTLVYAAWIRLGEISIASASGARSRGRSVWDFERWVHLPNEETIQHWCLHATWLMKFANIYYIAGHVFPLGIFLVWMFVRHRDRFAYWRNILGFVSLTCALIQTIPLAPPRMYPELGFVDAGAIYGPSVYSRGGSGAAGQLAAMPSMHVGWAMVIGVAAVMVSKSRWRWLGMLHAALTWFAVTVPAYHWLLDGIVATALLGLGMAIGIALRPVFARWRRAPNPHELAVLKG